MLRFEDCTQIYSTTLSALHQKRSSEIRKVLWFSARGVRGQEPAAHEAQAMGQH